MQIKKNENLQNLAKLFVLAFEQRTNVIYFTLPKQMIMKNFALLISTTLLCSSCFTYHVTTKETPTSKNNATKPFAFVTNPELKTEYQILQAAEIFELTKDSMQTDLTRITLLPLVTKLACGNPLAASMLTLGQVPVYLPDTYIFQFSEQKGNLISQKQFPLQIQKRFWFWDLFAFNKRFEQKVGQTLSANYYAP